MDILYKISIVSLYVFMVVFSYLDLKYHEMKRRYILFTYPVILFVGYCTYNFSLDLIIGFVWMFLFLWGIDFFQRIFKDPNVVYVGTCDIIVAPMFTIWYGYRFLPFFFIFGLVLSICETSYMKRLFKTVYVYEGPIGIPLIPCMSLSYVLTEYLIMGIKFAS